MAHRASGSGCGVRAGGCTGSGGARLCALLRGDVLTRPTHLDGGQCMGCVSDATERLGGSQGGRIACFRPMRSAGCSSGSGRALPCGLLGWRKLLPRTGLGRVHCTRCVGGGLGAAESSRSSCSAHDWACCYRIGRSGSGRARDCGALGWRQRSQPTLFDAVRCTRHVCGSPDGRDARKADL